MKSGGVDYSGLHFLSEENQQSVAAIARKWVNKHRPQHHAPAAIYSLIVYENKCILLDGYIEYSVRVKAKVFRKRSR